ncbi:MAG: serine/threonine protein phosphatase [Ponticaulis sp.]|nr:serine/threonine protein phosphatase [Ponticaulis sp.]
MVSAFALAGLALLPACAQAQMGGQSERFSIAVIPDTQNYVDYTHQTEEGFPFNARTLFLDQMDYIAANAQSNGGDIAFAISLGDVWQHASQGIDEAHLAMGQSAIANPLLDAHLAPSPEGVAREMATAHEGYSRLDGVMPFAVVPGNHDYDGNWSDSRFPPAEDYMNPGDNAFPFGQLHYGGLQNFASVFGEDSDFFRDQDWYLGAYNDGANSATVFEAGGYRFLHIGLEMAPEDDVLVWAQSMVDAYPGLPTIVSIHDHLNTSGERQAISAVDFDAVHPEHNNAEEVWRKFLRPNAQIFLVLSGHQHGQSRRVDDNQAGFAVHQMLSDYQDRAQVMKDIAPDYSAPAAIGDGWMRLMTFDFSSDIPVLTVETYSTHYEAMADELDTYASWYRDNEQPGMSDEAFIAEEMFEIDLSDFRERFAPLAEQN